MQEIITEDNDNLEKEKEIDKEVVIQKEQNLSEEKEQKHKKSKKKSKKDQENIKRIKIIEEQINNENFIINEYDSQLKQIKSTDNKQVQRANTSLKEKESIKNANNLISKLKSKNNELMINLNDLNNKQNMLELGSSFSIQEENQNRDKLKRIKSEKEVIQNKIKEIDNQIKIILDNEKNMSVSRAKLQKKFTDNIEEKKYIYNRISINKVKSSPTSFLKSIEELQKKEEEEKEAKKLEKFQNLRNRELEIIRRRKNKIDNLAKVIIPKYIQKKDYITAEEREEKRQMEEEALIKMEIKKRKMKLQPISSHELNKFSKEVQRNERMFQEELDQKKEQMKILWQERKNLLPEYKSKFFEYNKQNDEKMRDELILKKERIRQDVKDRIKFGEDIIKNLQPKYNDKLKNEREKNILKLKGVNKQQDIKEVESKLKKKANKITQSQPKNFKLNNKFVLSEAEGGKRNIKKLVPLDKTPDYLTEERINKEKNPLTPMIKSYEKVNKWENMLNDDKSNIYNNIEKIKLEADILQNKADTKKQLLKNERGSGNLNLVDDLNNEISNLYIGSIQAKLQILKKIGNN